MRGYKKLRGIQEGRQEELTEFPYSVCRVFVYLYEVVCISCGMLRAYLYHAHDSARVVKIVNGL